MKLIFSILILFTITLPTRSQDAYSFFIAGHVYGEPGVNNPGLHPPFINKFPYIQSRPEIQFGVFTGDIVSTNPSSQDWDEVDADISDLGLPVYFAVGNHDMENRPLYESRYGATYYSFTHENDLFIVLDPNLDSWNISGEQLTFFQNTINTNAASVNNIFILFHQLIWLDNSRYSDIIPNSKEGKASSINFWTEIEPLCHQLDNNVFFLAGDIGAGAWCNDFMFDSYDNITLIASGMGEQDGDNFVILNIDTDKSVSYDLICLDTPNLECFGEIEDYDLHYSVKTLASNTKMRIFPNPSSDYIIIENSNSINEVSFQLFNTIGRNIFTTKTFPSQKINIGNLAKGIYFYKIQTDTEYNTGKLIIIK